MFSVKVNGTGHGNAHVKRHMWDVDVDASVDVELETLVDHAESRFLGDPSEANTALPTNKSRGQIHT